jgi:hypothetical protein
MSYIAGADAVSSRAVATSQMVSSVHVHVERIVPANTLT